MSLDIGINMRSSSGYVTDGTNETYCNGEEYPVTRAGATLAGSPGPMWVRKPAIEIPPWIDVWRECNISSMQPIISASICLLRGVTTYTLRPATRATSKAVPGTCRTIRPFSKRSQMTPAVLNIFVTPMMWSEPPLRIGLAAKRRSIARSAARSFA